MRGHRRSCLITLITVLVILAAGADAHAGRRPRARILETSESSDQEVQVTLLVTDPSARDLDLSFEFRVKGRKGAEKGWRPADTGDTALGLTSSPYGNVHTVVWKAFDDLGAGAFRKVRLRASITNVKGKRKRSRKFAVTVWGAVTASDLHAELVASLTTTGRTAAPIFDTRVEGTWRQGHVPGAVYVPASEIPDRPDELLPYPADTPLTFYCYGGT
jgi:hypothetical protein